MAIAAGKVRRVSHEAWGDDFLAGLDQRNLNYFGVSQTSGRQVRGDGSEDEDLGRETVGQIDYDMLANDLRQTRKEKKYCKSTTGA
jgi:hypothetical protein